jgi:hypothetical protein
MIKKSHRTALPTQRVPLSPFFPAFSRLEIVSPRSAAGKDRPPCQLRLVVCHLDVFL